MCRSFGIIFTWCSHWEVFDRWCTGIQHELKQGPAIRIAQFCPTCIDMPDFPTSFHRSKIPFPTRADDLLPGNLLLERLHYLFYERFVIKDEEEPLRTYVADRPATKTRVSTEDLVGDLAQLYRWMDSILQVRRIPVHFEPNREGRDPTWDKLVIKKLLRIIVFNEIEAEAADPTRNKGLDHLPYLLTLVEKEDLPEDERDCNTCYVEFGIEHPDQEPEVAVRLPCGHISGYVCLQSWFADLDRPNPDRRAQGWTCPMCRAPYEKTQVRLSYQPKVIPSPWWLDWLSRPPWLGV